jgi:uncharacterized Fe-S cluster protein YjdI
LNTTVTKSISKWIEAATEAAQAEECMQEYKNDKIAVRYDPKVCIHAGECVRGLPSVFDVSKKPWIDVNGAAVDAIIEQVKRCPSGALSYEQLKKAE